MKESVRVERDLVCRAQDGTSLRTDVYYPPGEGPRPALLYRLPYGKSAADSLVAMPHPAWVAEQGFVVAVQDVRGRAGSEGVFQPFEHEAADGQAAVEWTAALEGCDGRVVSYGFSYPGLIQLLTAARRPRGLVGICPTFTGSQTREGWTYQGGALAGFSLEWALGLGSENARRAGDMAAFRTLRGQLETGSSWFIPGPDSPVAAALSQHFPALEQWCAHPADDGYWDVGDARSRSADIDVPGLHIGGWWDRFVRGTIENFTGLQRSAATPAARDGQRLVLGPWPHMPWTPLGEPGWSQAALLPAGTHVADLHLQWWRQLLFDEPSALLRAPVTMWVSGVGWQSFAEWPGASNPESWFLHSGGRAATRFGDGTLNRQAPLDESPDVLAYDPWMVGPRSGGHGCCVGAPMGPACQCGAEQSPSILVFTSEPVSEDLLVIGDVSVEVWMAWDSPSIDLCARLCVVDEAGCSTDILDGIYRTGPPVASHHPLALQPVRCVVDLGPIGRKLAAGECLRLQLSGSDYPLWEINMADGSRWSPGQLSPGRTATQVIRHDALHPSRLLLPVSR